MLFFFIDVVRQNWVENESANPFIAFKENIKRVKTALTKWSKNTYGYIFKQLVIREDIVKIKEKLFESDPSAENREVLQKAQVELKRYLHFEEIFWQQKAGYDWFEYGDRNRRFFHITVKGRGKKLQLNRIQNNLGIWLEKERDIAAVKFYQSQFLQESDATELSLLSNISEIINEADNSNLCRQPTLEEVKKAVFNLNGDSTSGPDGFSGAFCQYCWEIVGNDILKMVQDFFRGNTLPKAITHTNLVLLPKKEHIRTVSDLRPISLSNFINKILSRVVLDRIEAYLPKLISHNQSGFVKGRSIIENVLLAQEIVTDIRNMGKPANVVINLDMTKAYDRVYWFFLMKVLRKMGFSELIIDLIWRLISNNWYSMLINGQAHGFFHSTRGVKQGDPLSPSLFILSAEVLSRALHALFEDDQFVGYCLLKWSANLNHLTYADDTIIFV